MGGYDVIVLLNESSDFTGVSLYGFLFVNDATLSICSNHSLKDCRSLALNMGTSLIKCKFS